MRKYILAVMIVLAVCFSAAATLAQESEEAKVSTIIVLKNHWSIPDEGSASDSQKMFAWWHYKNLGGGFDYAYDRRNGNMLFNPFLTANLGPWYLVGGMAFDQNSTHVQGGFWYLNTWGKWGVLLDVRNYFPVSGKAESYLDSYLEITHPITGKLYAGIDLEQIHWWGNGGTHNWYFVGPLVGWKFTKEVSAFVRLSREWDVSQRSSQANGVRLGLIFCF